MAGMQYAIEYGADQIEFESSYRIEVKGMENAPEPVLMPKAVMDALVQPIGTDSLFKIAKNKIAQNEDSEAVIVVSDKTRPVPYYGREGLIYSIIKVLQEAGFAIPQIHILVGAGSHRNMSEEEIEAMIGLKQMGLGNIKVINHQYDQEPELISLGDTEQGSKVLINKKYYQADLKIVTGLVESHFMAGASGGRKGICPGIVGENTLTIFHGAKFLGSLQAADLILEGNPLHEEATEIALMAGCDFLVNVTLDNDKGVTGVYAGDLIQAHHEAVLTIKKYVLVPIKKKYDIVIIPAGFVGINHYQAAKAAIEAARAVKEGGKVIIVAKNSDPDPVGGDGYKRALKLLSEQGKDRFIQTLSSPGWKMIQEQWQVQMWCKVLDVIGDESNLYYCSLEIPETEYRHLPGLAGISMLDDYERNLPPERAMKLMIERSLEDAIAKTGVENPDILLLKDGPYGIPKVVSS